MFDLDVPERWWLLTLLTVPLVAWLGLRGPSGLDRERRVLAVVLRSLVCALLAFALAKTHGSAPLRGQTVLFVLDQSQSIAPESRPRLLQFLGEAVSKRGPGHERDRVGLIVFGRRPRLELPPGSVPG